MGAAQGQAALWYLPFRQNPFFTGREQVLSDLRAMLLASASAALVQPPAISGLGGIGKTQTAIEYAYRYGKEYAAVLWVQASSRETLIADITRIAALLHLPERDAREQDLILQAFKRWLEANTRWLLIFDNADDLHIVSDILPAHNSGHILFTTRATAMGDLAQRVSIDEMDREEGPLLLLRRAKILSTDAPLTNASKADLAAAQAIVEAVDGLPLALDQAGAYIEETQCSLADYLQLYQTHLLEERAKRKDTHPEPIATTWALSFNKVQQANPAAADLMRLCAYLAPDAIPEEMFLKAPKDIGTELQSLVGNLHKLNLAIKELLKYSLVRRDSAEHTIVVHRLVQAVLRGEMDEETKKQWAERAIRVLDWSFPDVQVVVEWSKCQQWLPHALANSSFIEQWNLAFPEAARLLNQAGYYLDDRAQYQEAEPLFKQALTIRKEVLGLHHPDTASSLNNLAYLYQAQGRLAEAEPLYEQALAIRKEVLGEHHPDTAQSLNNLGYLYDSQGRLAEAEPLYKQALTIRKKVLAYAIPIPQPASIIWVISIGNKAN
ncbi:MAG: tetratricopeptide repeat protein [Chloroflexota bacterium]|nr:tetratricopeptide repeat protein [Chloroflexota bacterium]